MERGISYGALGLSLDQKKESTLNRLLNDTGPRVFLGRLLMNINMLGNYDF
jgi:hypothetical protein